MARYYLLDGAYHSSDRPGPLPSGAVEVSRLPGDGEYWDAGTASFVEDGGISADMVVPAGHIDMVHILKVIEAELILAGYDLPMSILAQEALATGVTTESLAALVIEKASTMIGTEIDRRVKKTSG